MSTSSELERIERFFPSELGGEDSPMSAYTAYALRNNLNHLIDESPQIIICTAAPVRSAALEPVALPSDDTSAYYGTSRGVWSQEFIHTWIRPDRPTNLDLLVYARTESASNDMTVTARCVPAIYQIGDATAPDIFTEAGVTASGTTNATGTSEKLIDVKAIFTTPQPKFYAAYEQIGAPSGLNTKLAAVSVAVMRLEIRFTYVAPADYESQIGGMTLCMLREFC